MLWSPSVPGKPNCKSYWIWRFDPLREIVPPLCSHLKTDSPAVMKQDDFDTSPVPPTSHLWLFIPTSNHFGSFHGTYDHPAIESDPGHASRWPAARSQGISNLKAKERNKERHIIGKRLSQKEFKNFNRCQKNLGKKKTSRITVTFRGHFPSLPCPALTCPRLPLTLVTSAISPFLFASSRCRWAISWWLRVAYNERSHGDVLETVNHQQ